MIRYLNELQPVFLKQFRYFNLLRILIVFLQALPHLILELPQTGNLVANMIVIHATATAKQILSAILLQADHKDRFVFVAVLWAFFIQLLKCFHHVSSDVISFTNYKAGRRIQMLENKLSTNKSLTSDNRGQTKNFSRSPFEDKKKKYRKKQKPLTQEQIEVFRQAFEIFDSNKSNTIDEEELTALLTALGYQCSSQEIRKIMDEVDEDGSGVIQMDQFILFMSKHMLDTDNLKKQMTKIFDYFDDDQSGTMDQKKIKRMVNQCFFNIDDEAITKMIEAADTDGSGKISKYEFLRVMKKVKLL